MRVPTSKGSRRPSALALVVATTLVVTGCASTESAIRPMAEDALAATRSAELGIRLDEEGHIFSTTTRVVLEDMAEQLADTVSQLEQTQAADVAAERTRVETLEAARDAVDAIHLAQAGQEAHAQKELREAARTLHELAGTR